MIYDSGQVSTLSLSYISVFRISSFTSILEGINLGSTAGHKEGGRRRSELRVAPPPPPLLPVGAVVAVVDGQIVRRLRALQLRPSRKRFTFNENGLANRMLAIIEIG